MKELIVAKDRFQFDSFKNAILEFLSMIISDEVDPSTAITRIGATNEVPELGPENGRNNFLNEVTEGFGLFFPFTGPNLGEPIECANGRDYEIDIDTDCDLGDADTAGFLVKLEKGKFIIDAAIQYGGGHGCEPGIEITDCGVFDRPMKRFINTFVIKLQTALV